MARDRFATNPGALFSFASDPDEEARVMREMEAADRAERARRASAPARTFHRAPTDAEIAQEALRQLAQTAGVGLVQAGNAATLGYMPDIVAGVEHRTGMAPEGETYDETLARLQRGVLETRAESPTGAVVGSLAGGVLLGNAMGAAGRGIQGTGALATLGRAALTGSGTTLPRTMAASGLQGAAMGALAGANESRMGGGDPITGAAAGTVGGAMFGTAAPLIGAGIGAAGRGVSRFLLSRMPAEPVNPHVVESFGGTDFVPDEIDDGLLTREDMDAIAAMAPGRESARVVAVPDLPQPTPRSSIRRLLLELAGDRPPQIPTREESERELTDIITANERATAPLLRARGRGRTDALRASYEAAPEPAGAFTEIAARPTDDVIELRTMLDDTEGLPTLADDVPDTSSGLALSDSDEIVLSPINQAALMPQEMINRLRPFGTPEQTTAPTVINWLTPRLQGRVNAMNRALEAGDIVAANTELDQFKRYIGNAAQRARRLGDAPLTRTLQGFYEDVRVNLEDPAVWGEGLAAPQRAINAAWTDYLTNADAIDDVLTAGSQRPAYSAWGPSASQSAENVGSWPAVRTIVGRAHDPAYGGERERLTAALRDQARLATELQPHYAASAMPDPFAGTRENASRFEQLLRLEGLRQPPPAPASDLIGHARQLRYHLTDGFSDRSEALGIARELGYGTPARAPDPEMAARIAEVAGYGTDLRRAVPSLGVSATLRRPYAEGIGEPALEPVDTLDDTAPAYETAMPTAPAGDGDADSLQVDTLDDLDDEGTPR